MLDALLYAVALVPIVPVALFALHVTGFRLPRWPERTLRPYACTECHVEYTDARALAWHNSFHHPETYGAPHP